MKREDKNQLIETLTEQLQAAKYLYITDISDMNSENTSKLRRLCFKREVELIVVKNALLQKAMEKSGKDFGPLYDVLKGHTSIMIAEQGNVPAKLIKEFRKTSDKPKLKGAYVEAMLFRHCSPVVKNYQVSSRPCPNVLLNNRPENKKN